ncbi:MAG: glutathione-disulfide reductase [Rhodospirillaceae bacterium]
MTEQLDFDMITIGAGSGGVASSRRAASYGAKVAIFEDSRVGGTCVIRGCVPKKLLMYGGQFRDFFEDAGGYGWTLGETPAFNWPTLIARKNAEIDRLNGIYIDMLGKAGVTLVQHRARLVGPGTVEAGGTLYRAKTILIATGGRPTKLPIPGIEHAITSDDLLELPTLPGRLLVIGGGYIGIEFASICRAMGAEVEIVIRGEHILNGFDDDIRTALEVEMRRRGIVTHSGIHPMALEKLGRGGLRLTGRKGQIFDADQVLCATGRHPNIAGLGLDQAGVATTRDGAIIVGEGSRTSVPGIYAVGDVTNRMNLTPVAIAEGRALAETLFNANPMQVNYDNVPTAVFSTPAIGTVGLSEQQARARGLKIDIYRTGFRPMKHTLSGREERVLIKLVVEQGSERVLGCHMLGNDGPEIVQGLAVALNCGATKADFDRTIGLHPSAAEEFVTLREKVSV